MIFERFAMRSNCTFMELKLATILRADALLSSNCTFMELKLQTHNV